MIKPMLLNKFLPKGKGKPIFICAITENNLKIIKCSLSKAKREFIAALAEPLPQGIDDKKLTEIIGAAFKKLGYANNPLIVSLPRNSATCRYLKLPTVSPEEIERISALQASRYLPYPANELITGYETVATDRDGYSHINLVIVHRDIIQRYLKIFSELKFSQPEILLSSYGIANFYNYLSSPSPEPTMLIDMDAHSVEVAVVRKRKLVFSRYFKLNQLQPNWKDTLDEEIKRTQDAYLKEVGGEPIQKQIPLSLESPTYEKLNLTNATLNVILEAKVSFFNLLGLGLLGCEKSLNLLPGELKEEIRKSGQYLERLRLALFICAVIIIWFVGIAKNLDNKAKYLNRLKSELSKIAKDAKPLEDMDKALKMLAGRKAKESEVLDILRELYKVLPQQAALSNINYEEDKQITFRGSAPELNSVFDFVAQMEKSNVFKKFNIKVRYATKKRTQAAEFVDFEVICVKK